MAVQSISVLATFIWLLCGASSVADEDASPLPTLRELLNKPRNPEERRVYPPNEAAQYFVQLHDRPDCEQVFLNRDGRREKRIRNRILVITWFRGNGSNALQYEVDASGHINSVRNVYNWATQANHSHEIDYAQITELQALLETLPPSGDSPPIDRTVHLSFQDRTEWRTETYDADNLPTAMETVMEIIGERFETKEERITRSRKWPYGGSSVVPVWQR